MKNCIQEICPIWQQIFEQNDLIFSWFVIWGGLIGIWSFPIPIANQGNRILLHARVWHDIERDDIQGPQGCAARKRHRPGD